MMKTEVRQWSLVSNGAYWQVKYYDDAGTRKAKGIGAKDKLSKTRAMAKARAFIASLDAPGVNVSTITLDEWGQRWLRERQTVVKPGTLSIYTRAVASLSDQFGTKRLADVTPADMWEWSQDLRRGRSEATTRKYVRAIKTMFRAAVELELISRSPARSIASSSLASDRGPALTDEHVRAINSAMDTQPWKALVGLCSYAGLRRSEAFRVTWRDVDFDHGKIEVRNPDPYAGTKHRARTVRLDPTLADILYPMRCNPDAPVVDMPANNLERDLRKKLDSAGVESEYGKPFHALRAWRATSWRRSFPAHVVNAWLGHSESVANRHYVDVEERYYQDGDAPGPLARLIARVLDEDDPLLSEGQVSEITGLARLEVRRLAQGSDA